MRLPGLSTKSAASKIVRSRLRRAVKRAIFAHSVKPLCGLDGANSAKRGLTSVWTCAYDAYAPLHDRKRLDHTAGFEYKTASITAEVAQLAEHLVVAQGVESSSLFFRPIMKERPVSTGLFRASEFQGQAHRAVIRAVHVAFDPRVADIVFQFFGHKEIIDAPPHVFFPRPHPIRPPTVGARLVAVDLAEGVHIARGHEVVQPGPFLGQKAGVLFVFARARQVDGAGGRC